MDTWPIMIPCMRNLWSYTGIEREQERIAIFDTRGVLDARKGFGAGVLPMPDADHVPKENGNNSFFV